MSGRSWDLKILGRTKVLKTAQYTLLSYHYPIIILLLSQASFLTIKIVLRGIFPTLSIKTRMINNDLFRVVEMTLSRDEGYTNIIREGAWHK